MCLWVNRPRTSIHNPHDGDVHISLLKCQLMACNYSNQRLLFQWCYVSNPFPHSSFPHFSPLSLDLMKLLWKDLILMCNCTHLLFYSVFSFYELWIHLLYAKNAVITRLVSWGGLKAHIHCQHGKRNDYVNVSRQFIYTFIVVHLYRIFNQYGIVSCSGFPSPDWYNLAMVLLVVSLDCELYVNNTLMWILVCHGVGFDFELRVWI